MRFVERITRFAGVGYRRSHEAEDIRPLQAHRVETRRKLHTHTHTHVSYFASRAGAERRRVG